MSWFMNSGSRQKSIGLHLEMMELREVPAVLMGVNVDDHPKLERPEHFEHPVQIRHVDDHGERTKLQDAAHTEVARQLGHGADDPFNHNVNDLRHSHGAEHPAGHR